MYKAGETVWVVERSQVSQYTIKTVATKDGRPHEEGSGEEAYLLLKPRTHSDCWFHVSRVHRTKGEAQLDLASDLRARAAAMIREAEQLEASAN